MKLKIGRHEYEISAQDAFMDNGSCVQLLTQSLEKGTWEYRPNPKLSKRAIREIEAYERIPVGHKYGDGVQVFTLKI